MIEIVNGNILSSKANFIVHSCNCVGDIRGISAQIVDEYSHIEKEYMKYIRYCNKNRIELLGSAQYVPTEIWAITMTDTMKNNNVIDYDNNYQYIVNMFCQDMFEDGLMTDLTAMKNAFTDIRDKAKNIGATIAIPYKIGIARNVSWNDIYAVIKNVFERSDINVEIWK